MFALLYTPLPLLRPFFDPLTSNDSGWNGFTHLFRWRILLMMILLFFCSDQWKIPLLVLVVTVTHTGVSLGLWSSAGNGL
jgi:hypothetical protein